MRAEIKRVHCVQCERKSKFILQSTSIKRLSQLCVPRWMSSFAPRAVGSVMYLP